MDNIHWLIRTQGIDEARRQATTKGERQAVETAFQVLSDDAERIGFSYSGFALTSLPHRPTKELEWRREGHNTILWLASGKDQDGKPIGLPNGSYARFILLFLQSEAVKKRSREVELGRSMQVWLGVMGLGIGGKTYRLVNEQAKQISACSLTFFTQRDGLRLRRDARFVDGSLSMLDNGDQLTLWQERVLLNELFYKALLDHPVPVSESALKAIGPRSMVLDIYIWLAYRLHALKENIEIGWPALHAQFGGGFDRIRAFRAHFLEALQIALAAYPDACVSLGERGLVLHPSRPAIAKV